MRKRTVIILICAVSAAIVAAGLGVLIWWLVTRDNSYTVIRLSGEGIGDSSYTAALTRIHDHGDMFWWFYPTVAASGTSRPLILWLDGVTGVPPSLSANLGMFGPYDINFNKRENSWVEQYNLLFIDAPLGTGFSTPLSKDEIPKTIEENAEHLATTLKSFYSVHGSYRNAPLYIFGQGYGAQLALALAIELQNHRRLNPRGVVIANGIISPALVMSKLGFYLEELGYIADNGRPAIETLAKDVSDLVTAGNYRNAFDEFTSLGEFVNEKAGAIAVNLAYIVEKKTQETPNSRDYFGQYEYLRQVSKADVDIMNSVVASALGIPPNVTFDANRDDVIDIFKSTFMIPATEKIEYILQNTDVAVSIYNGNLDAVSNTPGQLEWINNLKWSGQDDFKKTLRGTLIVNSLVEGYFRETPRLKFYWMNAAGQSVPLDSPSAINVVLGRITAN
ncbi:serine carboxypeptidase-like 51 [Trichoplusia ni]|uniref:Serine carboxypeptidase-like 51 n=1 Tax=Trichoplusia ni TaxID=7111 RepID=A0A7E5VXJ6_TRINI|nr:serine carboxypeptidase-like 51 [Trichoplusia ni]